MKNSLLVLAALTLASCSQSTRNTDATATTDSLKADTSSNITSAPLYAKMSIAPIIKAGEAIQIRFTVYNDADSVQQFCKWHTPFEPLLSKYLDITDEGGDEVLYKGAMAKRIMPPPLDSYVKVNPKDSLSVIVDLSKGYTITKPSIYKLNYNAQNMSGLIVKDTLSFSYGK
ncbi:MAG: protease [Pedobacter sp.]|nr:MAG: protease [Pedobacter sp.]